MKRLHKVFWFFYKILAFYTLVVLALVYWSPSPNWFFGFLMLSFPIVIVLNLLSILFWLVVKPAKSLVPISLVLLSMVFFSRTYSFKKKEAFPFQENIKAGFTVMNYNVSSFTPPDRKSDKDQAVMEMKAWVVAANADVLCFPEYANFDPGKISNITNFLKDNGYKYKRLYRADNFQPSDYYGLAVLSKYPIIDGRDTIFTARNGLILTDIKIGKDTVRIVGVHLHSMTLRLYTLVGQKEMAGIKRESRNTFSLLKKGFIHRAQELRTLENWIDSSPHPVIVCGDFNETPYSYVYGQMRKLLTNGFEEKGSGFGFSYNHLPYFIRIDHQFYDKERLNLDHFVTDRSVKFSDHYPVIGRYSFK
jgi:endonuclease/exonuclease/phosphatase (EEP) superfamily protein YafD